LSFSNVITPVSVKIVEPETSDFLVASGTGSKVGSITIPVSISLSLNEGDYSKEAESVKFVKSRIWRRTRRLSGSELLSSTDIHSETVEFSLTSGESESWDFSVSVVFSVTQSWRRTRRLSKSALVSNTEMVTVSEVVDKSGKFSCSDEIRPTSRVTNSASWSATAKFDKSDSFKVTNAGSMTSAFSLSRDVSQSRGLSTSAAFSVTQSWRRTRRLSQSISLSGVYVKDITVATNELEGEAMALGEIRESQKDVGYIIITVIMMLMACFAFAGLMVIEIRFIERDEMGLWSDE
jgi:hypothetical protein